MKWKMIGIRDCIRPALGRHQCRRGQYIVDTQRYRDLASCHSQRQLERSTQSTDGSNQKSIRQSFRQQTVGGRERYIVEISYHQYRIRRLVYLLPDSLSLFVSPFVLALQEGDDLSKPSYTPHCRGVLKRVKIQPVGLQMVTKQTDSILPNHYITPAGAVGTRHILHIFAIQDRKLGEDGITKLTAVVVHRESEITIRINPQYLSQFAQSEVLTVLIYFHLLQTDNIGIPSGRCYRSEHESPNPILQSVADGARPYIYPPKNLRLLSAGATERE